MTDRTVRRLTALQASASTARVLNLIAPHQRKPRDIELTQKPFFHNRLLNESIILKHRVRPNEADLFSGPRVNATKILSPIDASDLRLGARSLMIGQKDFERAAEFVFADALKPGKPDRILLDLMDELPSLDPFLLREHLKRHGYTPARGYFAISEADLQNMYEYVRAQVMDLVGLCFATGGQNTAMHAQKLVEKLLSDSATGGFEPLKDVLKLSDKEYQDGVFCWRGFLYYKWVLDSFTPQVSKVLAQIERIQPRGPKDPEAAEYIPAARTRLQREVARTCSEVGATLDVYNDAYSALTKRGDPTAFRDFLLAAPEMFTSLGEKLGAIQHVVSFWRYRFPEGRSPLIDACELKDLFLDFEDSLACTSREAPIKAAA